MRVSVSVTATTMPYQPMTITIVSSFITVSTYLSTETIASRSTATF
ncbi:MAG: hypothetical protein II570_07390 [Bacteroidaceae bacterium]|nr:hypothetical protein [Bacteroidaceae bacterium]